MCSNLVAGMQMLLNLIFVAHYTKAKYYVQILHPAPRVPYLHGVTMPTKEKDPEMWAAVHIAVLRKHHCLSSKCCGQAQAVNHIRKIPVARRASHFWWPAVISDR